MSASPTQLAPTSYDAVIVGAGISGLAVARELVARGRSVAVLEARDRVGGRLLSTRVPDSAVRLDLGATWFWPNEPRVLRLIQELGIEAFPQHLDGDAMYHQPDGSQRISGNTLDVASGRFVAGADALPAAVVAALPSDVVRLRQVVRSVEATDAAIVVQTEDSVIAANHVVLALPPALAVHLLSFSPPLPERLAGLAAITPVWMGAITKAVVRYDAPFWRSRGLAGSAISHYGPMREIHDMSGPGGSPAALFGFVPATPNPSGDDGDEDTVSRDQIVAQLVEIFGAEAAEPVDVEIKDWRHEPFTSPPGVAALGAYQTYGHELFAQPAFDGRLHWCSTETAVENPGHIEGALAAAERAASAILQTPAITVSPTPTSAD